MKISSITEDVLNALDEYHQKSLSCQRYYFEGNKAQLTPGAFKNLIDDDLIYHVPIYDMLDRKYASFCSFLEALMRREEDPKGNGVRFVKHEIENVIDWFMLFYLFRLCGSGVNYRPGTHGFGNFWIVPLVEHKGMYKYHEWLDHLPLNKFSDNKGYLLPQFKNSLRTFILKESFSLVMHLLQACIKRRQTIIGLVELGNTWLQEKGYNRQNFVMSAFAADVAEYFPNLVDPDSMILAGTNAKKCIKAIFGKGVKDEEAIEFLSDRYKARPYSVEDSRLCDPVRYFLDYQSKYHILKNNGITYKNNSILKILWSKEEYRNFTRQLHA